MDNKMKNNVFLFMYPLELVGLGSSSSMDFFTSWKMNDNGLEKEEREETPLQGEDESRRSSPP